MADYFRNENFKNSKAKKKRIAYKFKNSKYKDINCEIMYFFFVSIIKHQSYLIFLIFYFKNFKILVSKIIRHMANYFRSENFKIIKTKNVHNLISYLSKTHTIKHL